MKNIFLKFEEWAKVLDGVKVFKNKSFFEVTTFKIGGKIELFLEVYNRKSLVKILGRIKERNIPFFVLGGGSNILASDKKHKIVVIKPCFYEKFCFKNKLVCGAGVGLFSLNSFAMEKGLSGLEFLFGVPGSVGGSIKMNAGCFGHEIGEFVDYVYFTDGKNIYRKSEKDLCFSYRHSFFSDKNFVVLRVVFNMVLKNKNDVKNLCLENLNKKRMLQPCDKPSAGSVFKRCENRAVPPLIESCNLKGKRRGGAEISSKHCGFIVNFSGKAKFVEVFYLICKIKKTVLKKFGIMLEEEIVVLK